MEQVSIRPGKRPDIWQRIGLILLWHTARHREFYEELKRKIHHAGYSTTERLTNALEYGVPQDRERVLLLTNERTICPGRGNSLTELVGTGGQEIININVEIPECRLPESHLLTRILVRGHKGSII